MAEGQNAGSASAEAVNSASGVVRGDGRQLYGLDAEIEVKRQAKRDRSAERELVEWVEAVTGIYFQDASDMGACLRSGVALCTLLNKIRPGTCPAINQHIENPLAEQENLAMYIEGCKRLGVASTALFTPYDLLTQKDLTQVAVNLHAVARVAYNYPNFKGPHYGPAPAANVKKAKKWAPVKAPRARGQYDDKTALLDKDDDDSGCGCCVIF